MTIEPFVHFVNLRVYQRLFRVIVRRLVYPRAHIRCSKLVYILTLTYIFGLYVFNQYQTIFVIKHKRIENCVIKVA